MHAWFTHVTEECSTGEEGEEEERRRKRKRRKRRGEAEEKEGEAVAGGAVLAHSVAHPHCNSTRCSTPLSARDLCVSHDDRD